MMENENNLSHEEIAMTCLEHLLPHKTFPSSKIALIHISKRGTFNMFSASQEIEKRAIYSIRSYFVNDMDGIVKFDSVPSLTEISSNKTMDELIDYIVSERALSETHTILKQPASDENLTQSSFIVNFKLLEGYQEYLEVRINSALDESCFKFEVNTIFAHWFYLPIFLSDKKYLEVFPDFLLEIYFKNLKKFKEEELKARAEFERLYNGLSSSLKLLYEGDSI